MTEPLETLSPILTRSSRTTPASDEGISIVALSDSSVMSEASLATRSPGLTRISMTSTLWKSPMSGTFTSIIWATPSSQKGTADVGQDRGEIAGEPRPRCTVDDAVIVGERQRQHQARDESPVLEHRTHLRPRDAEDGDLGRIDDGGEGGATDAAQARNAEGAAAHRVRLELLLARGLGDLRKLLRKIEHALAIRVLDHGHQQPVRGVDRDPDVVVLLDDQVIPGLVERGVELGELLERIDRGFHEEGEHGELEPA